MTPCLASPPTLTLSVYSNDHLEMSVVGREVKSNKNTIPSVYHVVFWLKYLT